MHAIQTSGNCVRNITTDHFAGVAPDEIVDSFVWCELIRQWSTFHPEFNYLPRKFKIAVNGARGRPRGDLRARHRPACGTRRERARSASASSSAAASAARPIVGQVIREFLPWPHLLTYLDAILRVYNRHGRRDNIHKARIKILVKERGLEKFRDEVEAEWAHLKDGPATRDRGGDPPHRGALHAARRTSGCRTSTISATLKTPFARLAEAQRASAPEGRATRR